MLCSPLGVPGAIGRKRAIGQKRVLGVLLVLNTRCPLRRASTSQILLHTPTLTYRNYRAAQISATVAAHSLRQTATHKLSHSHVLHNGNAQHFKRKLKLVNGRLRVSLRRCGPSCRKKRRPTERGQLLFSISRVLLPLKSNSAPFQSRKSIGRPAVAGPLLGPLSLLALGPLQAQVPQRHCGSLPTYTCACILHIYIYIYVCICICIFVLLIYIGMRAVTSC